jgi:hypothetical membrane protein
LALPLSTKNRNLMLPGVLAVVASVEWIIGVFVAQAYYPNYSITQNALSDLGAICHTATAYTPNSCLIYQPSSIIFNTTLTLFGVLSVPAAYFVNRSLRKRSFSILLGLFGLGVLVDGVVAENVQLAIHAVGGLVAFGTGAIAAITVYRLGEATPRYFQYASAGMGIISLVGTFIFVATPLGTLESSAIGAGGLERIILYPLMIWEALLGIIFLSRYRS